MQTYQKIINRGNKIVIWPEGLKEKDINEMIIAGMSPDEIQDMINKNTFQGPAAQLAFSRYNKRELR